MRLPHAWAQMPGPAHFLDTILEDLADRTAVVAGVPSTFPVGMLAVELAEMVGQRRLGRWVAIRSSEATTIPPEEAIARRINDDEDPVMCVDTTGCGVATDCWTRQIRLLAEEPQMPRVCIVVDASRALACAEDKRLRRRMWGDFVTALDSRALAQRYARRQGLSAAHTELHSAVIAELAREDLAYADQLARKPLGRILDDHQNSRDRVWAAQVAILFPVIERERQRLIRDHLNFWHLPYTRPDGREIGTLDELEIGDLAAQLRRAGLDKVRRRAEWLRRVRNDLAHNKTVAWSTLVSHDALQVVDFR